MAQDDATKRIQRYRNQSLRLLDNALTEMRNGRWTRSEDLLWGSLTQAVKGVALSRGDSPEDDAAVRAYATKIGQEHRDRRIRDAFEQLGNFSETLELVRDSRSRVDQLFLTLDDVSSAVERLWELVPGETADEAVDEAVDEV
ncbi:MAG: hypothetical protein ACE5Q6_15210 [Dehalococcoidia bacterium]